MDNFDAGTTGDLISNEEYAQLDPAEALVRLLDLAGRYDGHSTSTCPYSVARAAVGLADPHPFAFGCCRDFDPIAA